MHPCQPGWLRCTVTGTKGEVTRDDTHSRFCPPLSKLCLHVSRFPCFARERWPAHLLSTLFNDISCFVFWYVFFNTVQHNVSRKVVGHCRTATRAATTATLPCPAVVLTRSARLHPPSPYYCSGASECTEFVEVNRRTPRERHAPHGARVCECVCVCVCAGQHTHCTTFGL